MYNVPSFTLARAIGGVVSWYWLSIRKQSTTPLIIIASVRLYALTQLRRLTLCAGLHPGRRVLEHCEFITTGTQSTSLLETCSRRPLLDDNSEPIQCLETARYTNFQDHFFPF